MFRHSITIDEMKQSPNIFVKENGLVYNGDSYGQGLDQLYGDYKRGLVVFGRDGVKEQVSRQGLRDFFHCGSRIRNIDDFIRFVKKNTSLNEAKQLEMYSQACMLLMGAIGFTPDALDMCIRLGQPTLNDREFCLEKRLEENDGVPVTVIYQRLRIKRHPIVDSDGILIGCIPGPTEALFKLTDRGFEFQGLQTDSELIRNLYLYHYTAEELYYNLIQVLLTDPDLAPVAKENLELVAELMWYVEDHVVHVLKQEMDRLTRNQELSEPVALSIIQHSLQAIQVSMKEHVNTMVLARHDKVKCQRVIRDAKHDISDHLHQLHLHPALDISFSQRVKQVLLNLLSFIDIFGIFKRKNNRLSQEIDQFGHAKSIFSKVEHHLELKEFKPTMRALRL